MENGTTDKDNENGDHSDSESVGDPPKVSDFSTNSYSPHKGNLAIGHSPLF